MRRYKKTLAEIDGTLGGSFCVVGSTTFLYTDVYCAMCLGVGIGYADQDVPGRKRDGRKPSLCGACRKSVFGTPEVSVWMTNYANNRRTH